MSRLATRRLIDASATLGAADRALLSIWVNRGLDDAALARMTGMSEETIADRRSRIVEHLSAVLGLPEEDVRSTLAELVASPEVHPVAADGPAAAADAPAANGTAPASELADARPRPNGAALPELVTPSANGPAPPELVTPSANGPAPPELVSPSVNAADPPPPGDTPDADASAAPALAPDTESSSRRRRRYAMALFVIVVVVVVLIVSLGSSGSGHHRGPAPRVTPASTQTVPPTSTTTPSSSPTASRALVALPGGPDHATGTVRFTGTGQHLTLYLSVSNLPAASHGHYEVWLYDSIINSEALGRLRTGVTHLSLRLPGDASRYRWIDISFQPVGAVFHSGESQLRSANPLFGSAAARRP
jgi:hypothetical protein